ncbi:low molecular weight phosphatase family protein [Tenacibaculum discolor]|uniref:phosphotyrosine protein phosphatase n=1 Tax=Tenacibaculum discolor TaxID=361581 RepID=UPI000F594E70|nr:phosphotyrosine protein phosphatase [Tenacibaculum discolor]
MKILFVCSANKERSKTADDYFSEKYPNIEFQSAGTNINLCRKEGTNELTEDLLIWSDKVFVMEAKHFNLIKKYTNGKYGNKITVLNIPDNYKYYSQDLIDILKQKVIL